MKPPYFITPRILQLIGTISIKLGEVNANYLSKQSPQLRKSNRIKTIHASLQIEGNTLSLDQVIALVENNKIIGPEKDIKEVLNAIDVYKQANKYKPESEASFLKAHKALMNGLVNSAGKYRTSSVGIIKGKMVTHVAPPAKNVLTLMKGLFAYLREKEEPALIRSCVFHYEMEFIHPFSDGNGRMGRLWQTVILMNEFPVFEFLPFETLVSMKQREYYSALSKSDKAGNSTSFIEFMLSVIDESLGDLLQYKSRIMTDLDRLEYFFSQNITEFSRKDYMNIFKDISSATASRDLKKAIQLNKIIQFGVKNTSRYKTR